METFHKLFHGDARKMHEIASDSIDLIVTSPPYPMIEMWDGIFASLEPEIGNLLVAQEGKQAYNLMHEVLNDVWRECFRVLKNGSMLCINIGDATRSIKDNFQLFTNHSMITISCEAMGFTSLPCILWRKPTNAPNKFMGSGMLPGAAYPTLEHEYILIFRKEKKRTFSDSEKENRRKSAYFWEERNKWFCDLWDLKGSQQKLSEQYNRSRSAAFPLEIPHRLIQMFSSYGQLILDPFIGTGTTIAASLATGRNSIGIDIDDGICNLNDFLSSSILSDLQNLQRSRLSAHRDFMLEYEGKKGETKYYNSHHNTRVITAQERDLVLQMVSSTRIDQDSLIAAHEKA